MASGKGLAYRPRIADAELRACLDAAGAVVIEGPKACGKTRLAQQLDGTMFHYRDDYCVEVDAIVQLRDGRWGAIEIKLGPGQVEAAAAGLLRFRQQIDPAAPANPPSWRWSAAAAMATAAPTVSPWCRWGRWGPEQARGKSRPPTPN